MLDGVIGAYFSITRGSEVVPVDFAITSAMLDKVLMLDATDNCVEVKLTSIYLCCWAVLAVAVLAVCVGQKSKKNEYHIPIR